MIAAIQLEGTGDGDHDADRHAPVNGLAMYYEIHGTGAPLVLLHGRLDTIDTCFGALLPVLAESRQVVATELQGRGRPADIDREQGAFLDGYDNPAQREQGTVELLDALGAELRREAASA